MEWKKLKLDRIKLISIGVIITTIVLIVFRILFLFFDFPTFMEEPKDGDFYILLDHMKGGLSHFYDKDKSVAAIYLYFWYFLFFPFYIIPSGISLLLWDILRLVSFLYVINNIKSISKDDFTVYSFILLSYIGYFFDAYLGNSNFIILFFLFESYQYLENDEKIRNIWIAGIFFAIACFKITTLIILIIFIIIRRLNLKRFIKYIIPFLILLIPYIIFPDLLIQFFNNLFILEDSHGVIVEPELGNPVLNFLARVILFGWQALQPAQLMVYSFFFLLIVKYLKERKKSRNENNIKKPLVTESL